MLFILVVVYSSSFVFVVVQLGVVMDLKEKVARSSLSSPSVVRVCVVGMVM